MGKYDNRPYRVGKGKPPREHQWAEGTSGNPAGGQRKKKRPQHADLRELLQFAGARKIVAETEHGDIKISMIDALIKQLFVDILEGTPAHRLKALTILESFGVFNAPAETFAPSEEQIAEFVDGLADEYHREQAQEAEWAARAADRLPSPGR